MTCAFCGKEFDEKESQRACKACALFGGCRKVRCPHCGYESPQEPAIVRLARRWRSRRK